MTPEEVFALDERLHPNSGAKFGPAACEFILFILERNVSKYEKQAEVDEDFLANYPAMAESLRNYIKTHEVIIEKLRKGSEIE